MTAAFITHPLVRSDIRHPKLTEVVGHPRPRYKGHWAVGTRDLEQSNQFYETLARTQLICRPASFSTAISWDDEHHRFFIMDVAGMKRDPATGQEITPAPGTPQDRTGVGLASLRFATPSSLVRVYRAMAEGGWKPEELVDRGSTISLIYRDPDGLFVETFAPTGLPTAEKTDITPDAFLEKYR